MNSRHSILRRRGNGLKGQTNFKNGSIALAFLGLAAVGLAAAWSHFHGNSRRSGKIDLSNAGAPTAVTPVDGVRMEMNKEFGKLPLSFIENRGQIDDRVAYYVQGRDKSVYFTGQGLTFVLTDWQERKAKPSMPALMLLPASFSPATSADERRTPRRWALKLDFIGARSDVRPQGLAQAPGVISYLKGDPSQWHAGLKTYQSIVYRDLWPGIDLIYAGTVSRMKYSFVVKPGADPNRIKLAYRGVTDIKIDASGKLEVKTPAGGLSDEQPVSHQEASGKLVTVSTAYKLEFQSERGAHVYGFQVGEYDRSRELVIDPAVLIYCSLLGASGYETRSESIALDTQGNAYIAGYTTANNSHFPTGPAFGPLPEPDHINYAGNDDAFVAKINGAGTDFIYVMFIGGNADDRATGVAVDSAGHAYLSGYTRSDQSSFPVGPVGPDLTFNGGKDAFVAKVNLAGTGFDYCGYIGGSDDEYAHGMAVDSTGHAYLTGSTKSSNATFPVGSVGPDLTFNGVEDAFVVKVNAAGVGLDYCGYIGGSGKDFGLGIAVDSAGNAYLTGYTESANSSFPDGNGFGTVPGPNHNSVDNKDAFVAKVNAMGTGLAYAGYIGGNSPDLGQAIAVDGAGNAYVAGFTSSDQFSFPVGPVGPDLTFNGSIDAFVAKVNATGSGLDYCGYIGGNKVTFAHAIAVDHAGNAYVTGYTLADASTFPDGNGFGLIPGPDQTQNGGRDAYIARINAAGTGFDYCGFIGGDSEDQATGIAVDSVGNAYLTGMTWSNDGSFPDGDGFGTIPGTGHGIAYFTASFIAKIQTISPVLLSLNPAVVRAGSPGFTLTVTGSNFIPGSVVRWNGGNRPTIFISATKLNALISAADLASSGGAGVTVSSNQGISNELTFSVCTTPAINAISPAFVLAGGPGFPLIVSGTNFTPKSVVRWDGMDRKTTFISSTQLKAEITAADISLPPHIPSVSHLIEVFGPGLCGGTSNQLTLTVSNLSDQ